MQILLFVSITVLAFHVHHAAANFQRVCYLSSWARYRPAPQAFNPDNYGAHLCTHLIWAFADLDNTATHLVAGDPGDEPNMYQRLKALKTDNPELKILLSLGGWNMGSAKFTKLVSSQNNMNSFASNAKSYLHTHGFDGLDVDWEFPTSRGSPADDKQRFTELLRILRQTFQQDFLLTAAVSADPAVIDTYYEPSKLSQYVDFLNVMTYDFHGNWENHTGHHSVITGLDSEPVTVKKAAVAWATHGVPKSKILIGIPFHAKTFTLKYSTQTGVGAPVTGGGKAGEFTKEEGTLAYYEVCKLLQQGAEGHRLVDNHVPYLVDGDRWVGYDDEKSIEEKVQYVVNEGFAGIFVWALDLDDFSGVCGKQFPLMNKIKDTFTQLIG